MDEHDQYESLGLDDSVEDERDLDQIMADRRAAEIELDTRDGVQTTRKLPHLLHDQGKLSSKLYFRQNLMSPYNWEPTIAVLDCMMMMLMMLV